MNNWQLLPASVFSEYAEQWDKLNQQLYQSHPLLDSRFVGALIRHFGDPQVVLAIYPASAEHHGNLLLLQAGKLGVWTSFLPSQTQISPVLCSYPEALQSLFTSLPGFPVSLDVLAQDPLYTFSTKALNNIERLHYNTTINIDLTTNFDDYWQQRPKQLRQNIRSYINRLNSNTMSHTVKRFSTIDELQNALIRYGEIESASWKGAEGTAIHASNDQGRFYKDILSAFSATGQAEIIELYINDQLAAARICLLNKEMLITLKTSFVQTFAFYSPSHKMLYLMLQQEFSLKRVRHLEFYTNAKPAQIVWSTEQRNIEHLTIYRSAAVQRAFKALRKIKAILN